MSEPLQPLFSSAEGAWQELLREAPGLGLLDDPLLFRAVFVAGMSAALSIAFHHGFAELRAELEAERRNLPVQRCAEHGVIYPAGGRCGPCAEREAGR